MGSGAAGEKMTSSKLVLLSSILATVPALPPSQPTTTTEASVKSRTNGLINDVKEINLFLNIPKGCDIVYDGLIKQLEGCRSGSNHGDPRLTSGCLLKLLLLLLMLSLLLLFLFLFVFSPQVACSSWTSPTCSRIAPTPPSSSLLSRRTPPLLRCPATAPTARQVGS